MPTRDIFHNNVKTALLKEEWVITHDPLTVQFGITDLFIDLGAEKLIAAEKAGRTIAVEIKSFVGSSVMTDFHLALGQFLNYQVALEQQDPARTLYTYRTDRCVFHILRATVDSNGHSALSAAHPGV